MYMNQPDSIEELINSDWIEVNISIFLFPAESEKQVGIQPDRFMHASTHELWRDFYNKMGLDLNLVQFGFRILSLERDKFGFSALRNTQ